MKTLLRSFFALALVVGSLLPTATVRAAAPRLLYDGQVAMDRVDPPSISCGQGVTTTSECAQPDTQIEPSIAVNPANSLNAVAAYQEGRRDSGGDVTNGYATTFDGGRTWEYGELPKLTRYAGGGDWDRASDAVVAFGPNNVVYANSLVFDQESGGAAGLTVNVSHDGGHTWGDPVLLHTDATGRDDKNWIVVDNDNSLGHHYGRVYVVWDQLAPVLAAYSDDEGKTWQTNNGVGYVVFAGQGIGSIPLVLNDGTLAVVFETLAYPAPKVSDAPTGENEPLDGITKLVIAHSPGAGLLPTGAPLVFGPPVTIATDDPRAVRGQRAGEDLPSAALDESTGKIFVAWSTGRFRADHVSDIALVSSGDLGATWSVAARVNPGPVDDEVDHWCPMVGVGADGTVHVAYRQRRENAYSVPNYFPSVVDTFYQRSTDHGATFGAPLQLNTLESDMNFGAVSRGGVFLGDYDQLAVAPDRVYVVRTEPLNVNPGETEQFTPVYHHQRAWVAVVSAN